MPFAFVLEYSVEGENIILYKSPIACVRCICRIKWFRMGLSQGVDKWRRETWRLPPSGYLRSCANIIFLDFVVANLKVKLSSSEILCDKTHGLQIVNPSCVFMWHGSIDAIRHRCCCIREINLMPDFPFIYWSLTFSGDDGLELSFGWKKLFRKNGYLMRLSVWRTNDIIWIGKTKLRKSNWR